jgi:hypothetical protein
MYEPWRVLSLLGKERRMLGVVPSCWQRSWSDATSTAAAVQTLAVLRDQAGMAEQIRADLALLEIGQEDSIAESAVAPGSSFASTAAGCEDLTRISKCKTAPCRHACENAGHCKLQIGQ